MAPEALGGPVGPSPVAPWPNPALASLALWRAPNALPIVILRTGFTGTATRGHLFVEDERWGYTLEDRLRPPGVKVAKQTCIPAGQYAVRLAYSPRFQKTLPRFQDVPGFQAVLFHGGNKVEDTEGCILVGSGASSLSWIFGSLSMRLVQAFEKYGGSGNVTILNGPGAGPYLTETA